MSAAGAARLLVAGAAWRLAGAAPAGRALVGALADGDETERAVAGIQLTRAGDRSVPLLAEALLAGTAPDLAVDVLGEHRHRRGPKRAAPGGHRARRRRHEPGVRPRRALRTLDDIDRGHP